jgi:hypothetical protein
MGGVRPLAAAGFEQPLRPSERQQGIKEEVLCRPSDQSGAELTQNGMVEARIGQFESKDILPSNAAADGIGGLAIR